MKGQNRKEKFSEKPIVKNSDDANVLFMFLFSSLFCARCHCDHVATMVATGLWDAIGPWSILGRKRAKVWMPIHKKTAIQNSFFLSFTYLCFFSLPSDRKWHELRVWKEVTGTILWMPLFLNSKDGQIHLVLIVTNI